MKKKILLIEDQDNVRESLIDILEKKGFDIKQAKNGREALKKLETFTPDLIISDVGMPPGIDGYETCRQIKQVRKIPVKVILYTATFDKVDAVRAKEAGADDFVVKGTEPSELFKAIKEAL